jgi:NlpC/P60 family putative phage cell wall peptidase
VWRELYGQDAEAPPPYRPDWAEVCAAEPMLEAARRWLAERPAPEAEPGDVLLFRMSPAAAIKHCAILSAPPTPHDPHPRMIHAYLGRAVVESWLGPWWRRRLVGAFSFPGVSAAEPLTLPSPRRGEGRLP